MTVKTVMTVVTVVTKVTVVTVVTNVTFSQKLFSQKTFFHQKKIRCFSQTFFNKEKKIPPKNSICDYSKLYVTTPNVTTQKLNI